MIGALEDGHDSIPSDPATLDPTLRPSLALGIFRAAALRNVAVSAPYMHDGRFSTLCDVIEYYDHDVKDGPYLDTLLRDWTRVPVRMNLTEEGKNSLEAFLNALTDGEFLADPKFSDPFLP